MTQESSISTTLSSYLTDVDAPIRPTPSNVTDSGSLRPPQHPCSTSTTLTTTRRRLSWESHASLSIQIGAL